MKLVSLGVIKKMLLILLLIIIVGPVSQQDSLSYKPVSLYSGFGFSSGSAKFWGVGILYPISIKPGKTAENFHFESFFSVNFLGSDSADIGLLQVGIQPVIPIFNNKEFLIRIVVGPSIGYSLIHQNGSKRYPLVTLGAHIQYLIWPGEGHNEIGVSMGYRYYHFPTYGPYQDINITIIYGWSGKTFAKFKDLRIQSLKE